MALTEDEQKEVDAAVAVFKKSLRKMVCRMSTLIFGLGGWVMFHHWHLIPAVVVWTLAALMFFASFSSDDK